MEEITVSTNMDAFFGVIRGLMLLYFLWLLPYVITKYVEQKVDQWKVRRLREKRFLGGLSGTHSWV